MKYAPLSSILVWVTKVPDNELTVNRGNTVAALSVAQLFFEEDSSEGQAIHHLLCLQFGIVSIEGWAG